MLSLSWFDHNCNFWTVFDKTGSNPLVAPLWIAKLTLTHEGLVPLHKIFQFSANVTTSFCQNHPNQWLKNYPFSDLDPKISKQSQEQGFVVSMTTFLNRLKYRKARYRKFAFSKWWNVQRGNFDISVNTSFLIRKCVIWNYLGDILILLQQMLALYLTHPPTILA